jgi:atypical dual specificity phosphatase
VIRSLTFGFGERVLLEDLTFDVPARGQLALLGPSGVGKSTLLRALARRAELMPAFWHTGSVRLGDRDLLTEVPAAEARRRVVLFGQKARLHTASVLENALAALPPGPATRAEKRARASALLEAAGLLRELGDHLDDPAVSLPLGLQRRLTLARIAAADPVVLLVDEPLRDLPGAEADRLEAMLIDEARRRAIVTVTHDLTAARRAASAVVLLVAGRQVASLPAAAFFAAPPDPISQRFVEQGNAWPDDVVPATTAPAAVAPAASSFQWLLPGMLGGMARPGIVHDEAHDLAALRALGVRRLVSLELQPMPAERLAAAGIEGVHQPIPDMDAPAPEAAYAVIAETEACIARGLPTVYHCKGGLGRTGTLLAGHLIVRGMAPLHALEELRAIHPRYVQSIAQERFLDELAAWLRARS